jgi:hypothetical protein
LTIATAADCEDDSDDQTTSPSVFSGLILELVPMTLLEFESIKVVDELGAVMEFHSGGRRFSHFTPSHLREHMVLGHGVVVSYREDGGVFHIVEITDAPAAETPGPS